MAQLNFQFHCAEESGSYNQVVLDWFVVLVGGSSCWFVEICVDIVECGELFACLGGALDLRHFLRPTLTIEV